MSSVVYIHFSLTVSVVVGKGCTAQCIDLLANTDCVSAQCACSNGYIGITYTRLLESKSFLDIHTSV